MSNANEPFVPRLDITKEEFERLLEYSHSLPSGTTIGKRWKAKHNTGWFIGEYVACDEPGMVGVKWSRPNFIGVHYTRGRARAVR